MVATDSYRLSVKQSVLEAGPEEEVQAIVPVKALAEVARLAAAADRDGDRHRPHREPGAVRVRRRHRASELIDGVFPNYKQLLPDS